MTYQLFSLTFLFLILSHYSAFSQTDRGLSSGVYQDGTFSSKCKSCQESLKSKPKEVLFGLTYDETATIYFVMNNEEWFYQLFSKASDGIGIDIIAKDQFPCGGENRLANSTVRRGELLKPVYLKDFKKDVVVRDDILMVPLGQVPDKFFAKDFELNLLFLRGDVVCHYQNFFNLEVSRWELLEMGLVMDTIPNSNSTANTPSSVTSTYSSVSSKTMKFEVPFKKGRATFTQDDIRPLYDSLRLTDYVIRHADIKAYSSVEGSTERNIELQQERAASIVAVLAEFQDKVIESDIESSENWVEFIRDMNSKGDRSLVKLSKAEIKSRLAKNGLANELEFILKDHRKAIVLLELEKKSIFKDMSADEVVQEFEASLLDKNVERAIVIQQELFSRVDELSMPHSIVSSLEIPNEIEFGSLLTNRLAFDYRQGREDVLKSLLAFRELEYLLPKDAYVQYNIAVLEIRAWIIGQSTIEPGELLRSIHNLYQKGLERSDIDRLKVNYHILASEYYMRTGEFDKKDRSVEYIRKKYRGLVSRPADLLQVAKYFASYAMYDQAEKTIVKEATQIDADPDLLFYSLSLTMIDPERIQSSKYRQILLNAVNADRERFCGQFESFHLGGVNFQLLDNPVLKKAYCESCQ